MGTISPSYLGKSVLYLATRQTQYFKPKTASNTVHKFESHVLDLTMTSQCLEKAANESHHPSHQKGANPQAIVSYIQAPAEVEFSFSQQLEKLQNLYELYQRKLHILTSWE
jgi:hypothetical protein